MPWNCRLPGQFRCGQARFGSVDPDAWRLLPGECGRTSALARNRYGTTRSTGFPPPVAAPWAFVTRAWANAPQQNPRCAFDPHHATCCMIRVEGRIPTVPSNGRKEFPNLSFRHARRRTSYFSACGCRARPGASFSTNNYCRRPERQCHHLYFRGWGGLHLDRHGTRPGPL